MTTFRVEIKGLAALRRKLKDDRLLLGPLRDTIRRLTLLAQREAQIGAPRDTGNLQRSIAGDVRPLMGWVHIVGTAKPYAPVMEFGRRAGARMPPPEALAGWARRHGFGTSRGGLFILARAIARRGIKGRFFMRRAFRATQRAVPSELAKMRAQVERFWGG